MRTTHIFKAQDVLREEHVSDSDYSDAVITETEIRGIHEETSKLSGAQNEED